MTTKESAPAKVHSRMRTPLGTAIALTAVIWTGLFAYGVLVTVSNDPGADGIGWGIFAFIAGGVFIAIPLTGVVWLVAAIVAWISGRYTVHARED